jgi:hypothetical protein
MGESMLIIHYDDDDDSRTLREVYQMQKQKDGRCAA